MRSNVCTRVMLQFVAIKPRGQLAVPLLLLPSDNASVTFRENRWTVQGQRVDETLREFSLLPDLERASSVRRGRISFEKSSGRMRDVVTRYKKLFVGKTARRYEI